MVLIQNLRMFGFGMGRADERSVIRRMRPVRRKALRISALQAVFHKFQAACNTTLGIPWYEFASDMALVSMEPHLVQMLLDYWKRTPLACDTPEGIQRWWLLDNANWSLAQVSLALSWLVEHGAIEALAAADKLTRYRWRSDLSGEKLQMMEAELTAYKRDWDA